jgi:hypothetical protein
MEVRGRHTVLSNVTAILINVLELAKGLDDVDVLARPGHDKLRAFVQTVIEDLEGLEDVAPVLALIVEALVDHVHDVVKVI